MNSRYQAKTTPYDCYVVDTLNIDPVSTFSGPGAATEARNAANALKSSPRPNPWSTHGLGREIVSYTCPECGGRSERGVCQSASCKSRLL